MATSVFFLCFLTTFLDKYENLVFQRENGDAVFEEKMSLIRVCEAACCAGASSGQVSYAEILISLTGHGHMAIPCPFCLCLSPSFSWRRSISTWPQTFSSDGCSPCCKPFKSSEDRPRVRPEMVPPVCCHEPPCIDSRCRGQRQGRFQAPRPEGS